MGEWVNVEDRLPGRGALVFGWYGVVPVCILCCYDCTTPYPAWLDCRGEYVDAPMYWRPINWPDPPEQEAPHG